MAAKSMMIANGKALAIAAVCSAVRPPASKSTAATIPSELAQNTRCQAGVSMRPPEASESMTSEPESDEVTKKVMIRITVTNDNMLVIGKFSYSLKSAIAWSACTSAIRVSRPSFMIMWSAVSPNTENQKKVKIVGTSMTPKTNWRMVRPRLILAIKSPTKGAQAIVQPKMNKVQLPIQSLRL